MITCPGASPELLLLMQGAEVFMQISVRNQLMVARDLVRTKISGRDISDLP